MPKMNDLESEPYLTQLYYARNADDGTYTVEGLREGPLLLPDHVPSFLLDLMARTFEAQGYNVICIGDDRFLPNTKIYIVKARNKKRIENETHAPKR